MSDNNRLFNTITGFAPALPTFPFEKKKAEDPEWEFKDANGDYKKWTQEKIAKNEKHDKFFKNLQSYMSDLSIVERDVNYLYRFS